MSANDPNQPPEPLWPEPFPPRRPPHDVYAELVRARETIDDIVNDTLTACGLRLPVPGNPRGWERGVADGTRYALNSDPEQQDRQIMAETVRALIRRVERAEYARREASPEERLKAAERLDNALKARAEGLRAQISAAADDLGKFRGVLGDAAEAYRKNERLLNLLSLRYEVLSAIGAEGKPDMDDSTLVSKFREWRHKNYGNAKEVAELRAQRDLAKDELQEANEVIHDLKDRLKEESASRDYWEKAARLHGRASWHELGVSAFIGFGVAVCLALCFGILSRSPAPQPEPPAPPPAIEECAP